MKKSKKPSRKPASKKQIKTKPKPISKTSKKGAKKAAAKKTVLKKKKTAVRPGNIKKTAPKQVTLPKAKQAKPVHKIPEIKPKGLYSIEYELNSSPDILFEFISTPGGLEKWFADRVYIIESNFIFNWEDGEKRMAKQIGIKEKEWVRYHWLDEPDKRYFEFKIVIDDLTGEVALVVSDFADNPGEHEESVRLWNQQINDLHHSIGSA